MNYFNYFNTFLLKFRIILTNIVINIHAALLLVDNDNDIDSDIDSDINSDQQQ